MDSVQSLQLSLTPDELVGGNRRTLADAPFIIPRMIFGIFLILAWLPSIIFSELTNKSNRKDFKNIINRINEEITFIPVNVSGTIISVPDAEIDNLIAYRVETTITRLDNEGNRTTELVKGNLQQSPDIKFTDASGNQYNVDDRDIENLLVDKRNVIVNDSTQKTIYYLTTQQPNIMFLQGMKEIRDDNNTSSLFKSHLYQLEVGSEQQIKNNIRKRLEWLKTIIKWGWRIINVMALSGGLQLLIEPIRFILNTTTDTIAKTPILNIFAPIAHFFGDGLLALYDTLSFTASIILTILLTLIVYYLINKPLISLIFIALLVGLIMYVKHKNK
jgi:hypothetical protein